MGQLQYYIPLLILAIAVIIGGAGVYAWRQGQATTEQWRQQMRTSSRLKAQLETLEALLNGESGTLFLWDGDGSLRVHTSDETYAGLNGADAYAAFCEALTTISQAELRKAMQILQERGTAFAFPLFCKDERALACSGKPVAAGIVLSISDVSEAFEEIITLRDALTETLEERDFLRHAINAIPYPSWRRDINGRLNWVNAAYCRAVGIPSVEAVVTRAEELIDRRALDDARPDGNMHRLGTVLAGQRRILDLFELATDKGSVGIAVDVTEIDDAQNEIRRQLTAQRASLNLLHTPVAIFSPDRALEFFNQSFADLWGLPADWLANGPDHGEVLEAMRESRRIPEQADFPAWKKKQLGCYSNLIDSQEEIWQLPNERTLRVVTQARPQGGLFVLYEDLTEMLTLKRSLNALSKVQLETLNSLKEGVAVFGVDGKISLFNPALLHIWKLDEALLVDNPHIEDLMPIYKAYVPGLEVWEEIKARITGADTAREMYMVRIQRTDDTVLDCMIVPLPDGGTMLSFSDVTDAAQIEQALRERNDALETTDRLKSEFITHISYQFRTPLNSIIGFAEILEHEFFGPLNERQHEYSQGLLEASHHLLTLVNDVIDLATIEAGHMSLARSQIDIRELLLSVHELSRQRARESDMMLTLDCANDIGFIHADARRIKQVMFNLISNAIQFSSAGDEIIIGANRYAATDGRAICQLWVRDKGVGIDRNYQTNMFKSFEARSPKGKEKGAGIGLSLVRSLVELHDGWVEVGSELNQGTKVICNLPLNVTAESNVHHVNQLSAIQVIPVRP